MENIQFDTDNNEFKCVECNRRIRVEAAQKEPRPISCEGCSTIYNVAKNQTGGLSITIITKSEPDIVTQEEEELEDEYSEDSDKPDKIE